MTLLKATAHQGQNEISFYATKKRFNNISSIDINEMPYTWHPIVSYLFGKVS